MRHPKCEGVAESSDHPLLLRVEGGAVDARRNLKIELPNPRAERTVNSR